MTHNRIGRISCYDSKGVDHFFQHVRHIYRIAEAITDEPRDLCRGSLTRASFQNSHACANQGARFLIFSPTDISHDRAVMKVIID